jgi:hypothetical protein
VAVGQDDGTDVIDGSAHGRQLRHEVAVERGYPGVDDRDLAGLLDEIAVDMVVTDAVEG